MKNYYLYFSFLLFFVSCDSSILEEESDFVQTEQNEVFKFTREGYDLPNNPSNDFDYAGQLHNAILLSYYEQASPSQSIDSILSFVTLKIKEYPLNPTFDTVDFNQIQVVISSPELALESFLSTSSLSFSAEQSLHDFISAMVLEAETDVVYEEVYEDITQYESEVASNLSFTSHEKEIILSITSIVRHSVYEKKKRPKKNTDLDWDWLTTNIIGATAGASGDITKGITTALVAGIVANP